jgi:hypothetical protein
MPIISAPHLPGMRYTNLKQAIANHARANALWDAEIIRHDIPFYI